MLCGGKRRKLEIGGANVGAADFQKKQMSIFNFKIAGKNSRKCGVKNICLFLISKTPQKAQRGTPGAGPTKGAGRRIRGVFDIQDI